MGWKERRYAERSCLDEGSMKALSILVRCSALPRDMRHQRLHAGNLLFKHALKRILPDGKGPSRGRRRGSPAVAVDNKARYVSEINDLGWVDRVVSEGLGGARSDFCGEGWVVG